MKKQIFTMSLLLLFGFGLYAQPKAVGEPRVLVQTHEPLQMPVWSPDGSKLFLNNGTMEVSADGTNLRQVVAPVSNLRRNAVVSGTNSLAQQMIADPIHVASKVESLNRFAGQLIFCTVLSPTGDKIVFQVRDEIFVMNADGSGLRSLGKNFDNPTWTPDGKYIVVTVEGNDGSYITSGKLFAVNVATGAVSPLLTSDKYIAMSSAVSPDGTKLVFEEHKTGAIFIMDIK
jgi:Tol biopolymer transport system component